MEQPVKVRILDNEYLIRSKEGEKKIQKIAEFVDKTFREVKVSYQGLTEKKSAILVAFHIANEYFQSVKDFKDLETELQNRARVLNMQIDEIDSGIKEKFHKYTKK